MMISKKSKQYSNFWKNWHLFIDTTYCPRSLSGTLLGGISCVIIFITVARRDSLINWIKGISNGFDQNGGTTGLYIETYQNCTVNSSRWSSVIGAKIQRN